VQAVAARADELRPAVPVADRSLLVTAAWLHDIGYSPALRETGFHPLDGARYLAGAGHPLAALVAHHSGARFVAEVRGLVAELAGFAFVEDASDRCADLCGPDGRSAWGAPQCRRPARRGGPPARARCTDLARGPTTRPLHLRRRRTHRSPTLTSTKSRRRLPRWVPQGRRARTSMDRLPRAVVWSPYLAALPLTRKGMRPELSPVRSGGGAADRCAETSDRSLAGEPPAARRAQGRGDGNSTVARRQGDRKAQKEPTLTVATRPTTSADHGAGTAYGTLHRPAGKA
jgi:hypothetical protein